MICFVVCCCCCCCCFEVGDDGLDLDLDAVVNDSAVLEATLSVSVSRVNECRRGARGLLAGGGGGGGLLLLLEGLAGGGDDDEDEGFMI